jgi:hypothetical protein
MDNAMEWIREHSTTVLVVVIGLVIAVVFIKRPSGGGTSNSSGGDLSGLATDPTTGAKIIYRDVADTFINSTSIEGSNNAVNGNVTQPVASAPSGSIEHPIEGTVRSFNSLPSYDTKHPEGVPIRATPGGSVVGSIEYGTAVNILGKPVSAGSNFATGGGSNVWIPVAGGYVSAYDITGTYPA